MFDDSGVPTVAYTLTVLLCMLCMALMTEVDQNKAYIHTHTHTHTRCQSTCTYTVREEGLNPALGYAAVSDPPDESHAESLRPLSWNPLGG